MSKMQCACVSSNYHALSTSIFTDSSVMLGVANIAGAVILITALLHYFSKFSPRTSSVNSPLSTVIAVVVLSLGYSYLAGYYRESARELKRLDSALRSLLYSHFSESLSGLATIRAYGETKRFIAEDEYFVDLEDRALLLMCANQVRQSLHPAL